VVLFSIPSALSEDGVHFTHDQSVINTFQVMCQLEPLNFERLSERATAMRMILQGDNKYSSAQNTITCSKSWVGNLRTGPFIFLLDEMSGVKGLSTSCAVVANVPDVDAFRAEALKEMHLKDISSPELGNDGSRSYTWSNPYGQGSTLIIRDFKLVRRQGVMMKLLVKQ
jgi:hypothetical protein